MKKLYLKIRGWGIATYYKYIHDKSVKEISKFPEFREFRKIPRLSRDIVITEKIDGSNGLIYIDENNNIFVGSHHRWLWGSTQNEIHNDNHGFAQWVDNHKTELLKLGKGYHYGEWMGKGIQRNYGLKENRFYLFNPNRWVKKIKNIEHASVYPIVVDFPPLNEKQEYCPDCCHVVPVLYKGEFDMEKITGALLLLQGQGSYAVPGFKPPEGIVVYHTASGTYFKKTILNDDKRKGQTDE